MMDALVSAGRLVAAGSALLLDRVWRSRGTGLPYGLADLTAQWLTQALEPVAPGVCVSSFQILGQHSGTTTRARIALEYQDRGRGVKLPDCLFVKIAPHALLQRLFLTCTGIGRNEVEFYRQLHSDLPVRVPSVYAAECVGNGRHFAILMEDLALGGARFADLGQKATVEDSRQLVAELARLHACFWESPRFDAELAWVPCWENRSPDMSWERFVTGRMMRIAVRRFAADYPPEFEQLAEIICDHRDGLERLWAEGERTLVHGDCHLGNLFFEQQRVGFLDWQVMGRAPGMRDVSYFLCNSVPHELRQKHERELIRLYLEALTSQGVAAPDFEAAWQQHRLYAIYTWLAAAFTAAAGEGLQPREIAEAGMRRTTQAAIDLQSIGYARSRLGLSVL